MQASEVNMSGKVADMSVDIDATAECRPCRSYLFTWTWSPHRFSDRR